MESKYVILGDPNKKLTDEQRKQIEALADRMFSDVFKEENENDRKRCPVCNREIESYWRFCTHCGCRVNQQIFGDE